MVYRDKGPVGGCTAAPIMLMDIARPAFILEILQAAANFRLKRRVRRRRAIFALFHKHKLIQIYLCNVKSTYV